MIDILRARINGLGLSPSPPDSDRGSVSARHRAMPVPSRKENGPLSSETLSNQLSGVQCGQGECEVADSKLYVTGSGMWWGWAFDMCVHGGAAAE